jgi:hypothetical protein
MIGTVAIEGRITINNSDEMFSRTHGTLVSAEAKDSRH